MKRPTPEAIITTLLALILVITIAGFIYLLATA